MEPVEIPVKDNLHLLDNPEIKKLLGDEKLLFSDKIIKINRYGFNQERSIVITDQNIYNLKKKCKKKYIYIIKKI